jgi:hypothetical protein
VARESKRASSRVTFKLNRASSLSLCSERVEPKSISHGVVSSQAELDPGPVVTYARAVRGKLAWLEKHEEGWYRRGAYVFNWPKIFHSLVTLVIKPSRTAVLIDDNSASPVLYVHVATTAAL